MGLLPTILVCVTRSKWRAISRWRTTFPVPLQVAQNVDLAPWQFSQTRLPLPQVQSTSPLTQSGQGTVLPLLAAAVSTGLGVGTPCWPIPSKTPAPFSLPHEARGSAPFLQKGFFLG